MPLGIRAIVDFVFKKIFGSPENSVALIGLLNAILQLDEPIVSVEILNPFSYQEFANAKQIILDIRARDSIGRWFNIEMQVSKTAGLTQRVVYYACNLYVEQLGKGDNYGTLCTAISICLLDKKLFTDSDQAHHCFQLIDSTCGRKLENAIEVHTLELPKYNLDEGTIAKSDKLHQWVFLLQKAHLYDAIRLRELLPGIEFDQAIGVIETIAAKTEDRLMYDQREKALRDHEWALWGAREEGREEGRLEGEEIGQRKGIVAGKIQAIEELLGDTITPPEQLLSQPLETLEVTLSAIQTKLRNRQG